MVWRSVRAGADTKTKKSRRTLALPQRSVDALQAHRVRQEQVRQAAGRRWQDNELVFPSAVGTPVDALHMRRSFRKVVESAGLDPRQWTPRELRHSFVSLMPDAGVPVEHIARLVGHSGTMTTETVYRKQIARCSSTEPTWWTASSRTGSRMLSHSERIKGHPRRSQVACDLVGVAGFEPAASSSRTKRAAKLRYTPATAEEV
jgi:hypothetical protein